MKISEILKLLAEDKRLSEILENKNFEDKKDLIIKELVYIANSLKNDVDFSADLNEELVLFSDEICEQKSVDELFVYTDGATSGNPGMSGVACVILDQAGVEIAARNQNIGIATNNIAEYKAILLGLDFLKEMAAEDKKIHFFADSELMVKQIKGEYKIVNGELKKLCTEFYEKAARFKNYKISHIPREKNKLADNLAVLAKANKIVNRRIK